MLDCGNYFICTQDKVQISTQAKQAKILYQCHKIHEITLGRV